MSKTTTRMLMSADSIRVGKGIRRAVFAGETPLVPPDRLRNAGQWPASGGMSDRKRCAIGRTRRATAEPGAARDWLRACRRPPVCAELQEWIKRKTAFP